MTSIGFFRSIGLRSALLDGLVPGYEDGLIDCPFCDGRGDFLHMERDHGMRVLALGGSA